MNNDSISREALKAEITLMFGDKTHITESVCDIIDNVPTIPLPDFKEGYKQAIIDGKTNFSRQEGEWIIGLMEGGLGYCSCCGEKRKADNFCSNCGAKMKGDVE